MGKLKAEFKHLMTQYLLKETHRKEIEKKLEDKFKQEKEEIIKERKQLFEERKNQQAKIQRLEQKMELVEMVNIK